MLSGDEIAQKAFDAVIGEKEARSFPSISSPTVVRGVTYRSQSEASRKTGVAKSSIQYHLDRYGHCDNIGKYVGCKGNKNGKRKPVTLFGVTFASRKAAGIALGLCQKTIRRAASDNPPQKTLETVYAALMATGSTVREADG